MKKSLPVGFNSNLTYGLQPQNCHYSQTSIFQVEWLIATLNSLNSLNLYVAKMAQNAMTVFL